MGCDDDLYDCNYMMFQFQSTHPVWGATDFTSFDNERWAISIHAPRVGCDAGTMVKVDAVKLFQSTHPVWGATL